jgi:hypothetical protein
VSRRQPTAFALISMQSTCAGSAGSSERWRISESGRPLRTPPSFANRSLTSDRGRCSGDADYAHEVLRYFASRPASLVCSSLNRGRVHSRHPHSSAAGSAARRSAKLRLRRPSRHLRGGVRRRAVAQPQPFKIGITDLIAPGMTPGKVKAALPLRAGPVRGPAIYQKAAPWRACSALRIEYSGCCRAGRAA